MKNYKKTPAVENIISELDELETQLKIRSVNLTEAFQKHKKNFSYLFRKLHGQILELDQIDRNSSINLDDLKEQSQILIDILETDFNFSYTEFHEIPYDLITTIQSIEIELKKYVDEIGSIEITRENKIISDFKINLTKFKNELAIQQRYVKALKNTTMKEFDIWKEQLLNDIKNLKFYIDNKLGTTKSKLEDYNQISSAYNHLKNALSTR